MHTFALLALALDNRDADVINTVIALAPALGLKRVHLVYVHPRDPLADPLLGGAPVEVHTVAAPEGLSGYVRQLQQALPDLEISAEQAIGRPHEQVARLAQTLDADLVIIGRLAAQGDRPAWGSRGQLIARHAGRSVLVIPAETTLQLDDGVVAGIDFSARSLKALGIATQLGVPVTALYGFHVDPGLAYSGRHSPRQVGDEIEHNAQHTFAHQVLEELPEGGVTPSLKIVRTPRVSDALIEMSGESAMLVVGSRGMSPLASMLLGSTAERLAGLSRSAVLIIRDKGEGAGFLKVLRERVSG